MKLCNARNVCKKINDNAVYNFLFDSTDTKLEDKVNKFIEKFADQHALEATTVAPGMWTFSHETYGHLNDGVIELGIKDAKPVFKFRDVSDCKITSSSPQIEKDLRAAKNRIKDARIEYVGKLKTVLNTAKDSIEDLSFILENKSNSVRKSSKLDKELQDMQTKYHVTMDKLIEIQNSTEENYESLKASVEMSLVNLKYSIKNIETKIAQAIDKKQ